jgi:outer membrane protein assembly factor BamB
LALQIALGGPEWNGSWAFEGSPLAERGLLYVALRRRDSVRAESHVACFDARQGRLVWRRFLCAAETFTEPRPHEITHNLLTLDQGILYCNSNLGVVAALRAATGAIEWLTTYPRTAPRRPDPDWDSRYMFRDLNPCLVYRDVVFAAPVDSRLVLALDATSGHVLWMNDAVPDIIHLLGVADDCLLASGDCLYWLDIYTGRNTARFPRGNAGVPGHARTNPRGWGRGVLAGQYVYWPTADTIYVLEQARVGGVQGWEPSLVREIPLRPRGAAGGNLLIADGVLLIAAADRLYAFNETGSHEPTGGGRRPGSAGIE